MICKNCKFYTAPDGSESRWMICSNPKMKVADVYTDYKLVAPDGIGYPDTQYSNDDAQLYVGENFGCKHFSQKPSSL